MEAVIDADKLAMLPRDKVLLIRVAASGFTCVICGAGQEPLAWRVSLPKRAGAACVGCAYDHGWTCR